MPPNILNIVNFIRGCEPRDASIDLLEPVVRQLELVQQHRFPATWLLQYDALIQDRFVDVLRRGQDERQELGLWLEMNRPHVEAAGLTWRGRPGFDWDHHAHVAFSLGYSPAQRERLVDVAMTRFMDCFGFRPASVGAWLLDAYTLAYMAERYDIQAACICRDQVGTDGYTLWGGYFNGAYYPSRCNAYMPASPGTPQIDLPVFRMLGTDPIHMYEQERPEGAAEILTLEPVYGSAGSNPQWVERFFNVIYAQPTLSFGYAQAGQENSFGWPRMKAGFTMQMQAIDRRREAGLRVLTLGESGRWFRRSFERTPASAIVALEDTTGRALSQGGTHSLWYNSDRYRANLLRKDDRLWFRDLHLFDGRYAERYLTLPGESPQACYDTLPLFEGRLWSAPQDQARITLVEWEQDQPRELHVRGELGVQGRDQALEVNWTAQEGGEVFMRFDPGRIELKQTGLSASRRWGLHWHISGGDLPFVETHDDTLRCRHQGFGYALKIQGEKPRIVRIDRDLAMSVSGSTLELTFSS